MFRCPIPIIQPPSPQDHLLVARFHTLATMIVDTAAAPARMPAPTIIRIQSDSQLRWPVQSTYRCTHLSERLFRSVSVMTVLACCRVPRKGGGLRHPSIVSTSPFLSYARDCRIQVSDIMDTMDTMDTMNTMNTMGRAVV